MSNTTEKSILKGAQFLLTESTPDNIFIPEELNEEQLMIKQMTVDFVQ